MDHVILLSIKSLLFFFLRGQGGTQALHILVKRTTPERQPQLSVVALEHKGSIGSQNSFGEWEPWVGIPPTQARHASCAITLTSIDWHSHRQDASCRPGISETSSHPRWKRKLAGTPARWDRPERAGPRERGEASL